MYLNKNVYTRLWWAWLKQGLIIIIQLSYIVRIPIFWSTHVILGCDATTTSTSLSWCNSHDTMTPWLRLTLSLTICQMQTLILLLIMQFLKTPRKQLLGEYVIWTGKVANFKFFIQAVSWGVFACCQQFYQLCAVYSIWIIKMLTGHSLLINRDLLVLVH